MILLSTYANIISRMTAFVAVDKDAKKPVEGEMVKRPCPVPVATREFKNGLVNRDHFQSASCNRYLSSAYSLEPREKMIDIYAARPSFSWAANPSFSESLSTRNRPFPRVRVSAQISRISWREFSPIITIQSISLISALHLQL